MIGWNKNKLEYPNVVIPAGTLLGYESREYGGMVLCVTAPREYEGLKIHKAFDGDVEEIEWQTMKPIATVPNNKHI